MWSFAAWPRPAIELNNTNLTASWRQRPPRLLQKSKSHLAGAIRMRDIGCLAPMWTHWPSPYTSEEPNVAATLCAAGLQVSRKIQLPELELHIFNLMTCASELVTGWQMGRELLAGAGKSNGAAFASNWAFCRGWGVGPEATPARYIQAWLLARKLRQLATPAPLSGT